MKKNPLILLIMLLTGTPGLVSAQTEALFGDYIVYSSFGAPKLQLTAIDNSPALVAGGQVGIMADQRLIVAVDADWLITTHRFLEDEENYNLSMGQGGIMMRFNINPDDLINYSVNLSVGGGQAGQKSADEDNESSGYFYLNPNAEVNFNWTTRFRTALGFGYRLINGTDLPAVTDGDLSAPVVSLTLKFGGYFGN